MGRYANHEEFGGNAPINYREDTTSESFLERYVGYCAARDETEGYPWSQVRGEN